MITLYNIPISGNCHKVRLMLSFLNMAYQKQDLDLANTEQKTTEYLSINPFGQAPVLKDGDIIIRDSQAILVYLAKQYGNHRWWSDDAVELAQIHAWLSTVSNEIQHGPASLRLHYKLGASIDIEQAVDTTNKVLLIIEKHLSTQDWLVGGQVTIADIALYPYIALAHEGQVSLATYQHISSWMKRFESLSAFVTMAGIKLSNSEEMIMKIQRTPLPPFNKETALIKVRMAEDTWNSCDPERVVQVYTEDTAWRNRSEFPKGHKEVRSFLQNKWQKEFDYRLIKELWAFENNRIAVRFAYEWHDAAEQWYRSYGNENWEFNEDGLMQRRFASINDLPINKEERLFHWPLGTRPVDHPSLSDLGL